MPPTFVLWIENSNKQTNKKEKNRIMMIIMVVFEFFFFFFGLKKLELDFVAMYRGWDCEARVKGTILISKLLGKLAWLFIKYK